MCHIVSPLRTIDYHTAGEPFRIVVDGTPEIAGASVAERRTTAQGDPEIDAIRKILCHEPRGHADMYGGFVVPPDDAGADFGVLFWHKDGYSTACGHGTIALAVWAVQTGMVPGHDDGETTVSIDVPSGRVRATVNCIGGKITGVVFENVESWVIAEGLEVETSRGTVRADLSFSGAIYASVDASTLGLAVQPEHYHELIAIGREIKWALNDSEWAAHPQDERLGGVYGTILFDDLGNQGDDVHQRNVTVFADGEVDRSPCGSGTGARLALLSHSGRLSAHGTLIHDSIVDTRFIGRFRPGTREGTITPLVEGMAYRTGEHSFMLDESDPVGTGFVLR
jgi:proline racemase